MLRRTTAIAIAMVVAPLAAVPAQAGAPKQCRYLGGKTSLLPFPNDSFTKADRSSPTGRRVRIPRQCTPANKDGVHIDTTDQNRADGFSPGRATGSRGRRSNRSTTASSTWASTRTATLATPSPRELRSRRSSHRGAP